MRKTMNFRNLKDNDLADFAANVVALLAGTELSAIDSNVRADLVTAFGTLPATLATQTSEAATADDKKRAKVAAKNFTNAAISVLLGQVRDLLKANFAPKEQFELAGFDYPSPAVKSYVAQDPSDLAVYGFSNGVNKGSFTGNNTKGRVMYDIWRREGDDGAWAPHLMTTRQRFTDTGVTPGQYYEYRVRAVAPKNTSNFSNSAVVYGVL
jgi:hypothetical protein